MPDISVEQFFEELGEAHVRLLQNTSGTVLVELRGGPRTERWYVNIRRGEVGVARSGRDPDCVIRTDRTTLEAILSGRLNAMPALLRGLLEVEGKVNLLAALQALFRPSAGATEQREHVHAGRRG
jgi:putative sterol carrier protein